MSHVAIDIKGLELVKTRGATRFRVQVPVFCVRRTARLALTGPSGCGKSTLLDALAMSAFPNQLDHYVLGDPDGSTVSVTELLQTRQHNALAAIRCRYIGYVLQTGGLLPFLTVARNILLPSALRGPAAPTPPQTFQPIVQRLGLERHLRKLPAELSVGERQRVAVARAVVSHPPIVLADEPTAALDPHTAREVMALLLDLTHDAGITLVIASHDHALLDAFDLPRTEPVLRSAENDMTATFCYRGGV